MPRRFRAPLLALGLALPALGQSITQPVNVPVSAQGAITLAWTAGTYKQGALVTYTPNGGQQGTYASLVSNNTTTPGSSSWQLLADPAGAAAAETTRATAAETANSTAISTETTNRTSAVSAETTRATAAETANSTAISTETTNRTSAVSAETTRATAAEAAAQSNAIAASDPAGSASARSQMEAVAKAQPGTTLVGLYEFDATDAANPGTIYDHSGNGNNCTYPTSGTGAPTMVLDGPKYNLYWPTNNTSQSNGMVCPGITGPVFMQAVAKYVQPSPGVHRRPLFGDTNSTSGQGFYLGEISLTYSGGSSQTANLYSINPSANYTTNMPTGNGYNLVSLLLSSTADQFWTNTQQFQGVVGNITAAPPTTGAFEVGASSQALCGGYCHMAGGGVYWVAVYSAAPTNPTNTVQSSFQAVNNYLSATAGITLGTGLFAAPTATPYHITDCCTSINAGTGGGTAPGLLMTLPTATYGTVSIASIPSSTIQQHVASDLGFEKFFFDPTATNILDIDGPATNDICNASTGISPATAWSYTAQYIARAQMLGWKTIVGTDISRNGTGTGGTACDTLIAQFNALERQYAPSTGSYLQDTANISTLAPNGSNYNNTTNYVADKTHPTAVSEQNMANVQQNVILAITGYNQQNPNSQAGNYTLTAADRWLLMPETASATKTLFDCTGLTGYDYHLLNTSAYSDTVATTNSETVTGSTTIAAGAMATFVVQSLSYTAGGCYWLRTQ